MWKAVPEKIDDAFLFGFEDKTGNNL